MVPAHPYPPPTMQYPPPTPYVTPAYQPAYHPNIHSQRWSESSSEKSVSDIQSFMALRKIKDIPHWKPNQYGQMPIYCESRDDYEFLVKAIVHRREVEPTFAALDMQRDAQKNAFFLQAMKGTIAQPFQELEAVSKSQVEFFTTQNQALQNLLQSKPSPQHIPPFSLQQNLSTNVDFPPSNSAPAANSPLELGKVLKNLNNFIVSVPSANEDKEIALVSQQELDLLSSVFTVERDRWMLSC